MSCQEQLVFLREQFTRARSVAEQGVVAAAGLAVLRECLAGRGFEVEVDETGLTVDDRGFRLKVVCRPRPSDGDRLWFWAEGGPVAEVDRIVDAVVVIVGRLRSGR